MVSLFMGKPLAPMTVATDRVLPVHYWDDTKMFRSVVLYYMMRFDDVLDVQKLETSLARLINRDGWCKLGARVRLNVGQASKGSCLRISLLTPC